jgi:hypothetical protein
MAQNMAIFSRVKSHVRSLPSPNAANSSKSTTEFEQHSSKIEALSRRQKNDSLCFSRVAERPLKGVLKLAKSVKTGFKRRRVSFNTTVIAISAEAPLGGVNLAAGFCVAPLCVNGKDTRSRLRSLSREDKCQLYKLREDLKPPGFHMSSPSPSATPPCSTPNTYPSKNKLRDSLDRQSRGGFTLDDIDLSYASFLKDDEPTDSDTDSDSDGDSNFAPMPGIRDSLDMRQFRMSAQNIFEQNNKRNVLASFGPIPVGEMAENVCV